MKIQRITAVVVLGMLTVLMGCNQGTSGGPGASSPPTKDRMGQTEDTFSLTTPSAKLNQGETKTVPIEIKRGKNFSEDVSLKIDGLPTGVTLAPGTPVIKHGETDAKLAITAADNAALGDFTIHVTGNPTKGAAAKSEMSLSVAKLDAVDTANATADAAQAKWDEYTIAMQNQWEEFKSKFAALEENAAKAEGQVKADLDLKLADAKVKMDAAAGKIEALKTAGADQWENVKEGVTNAFEELKKIFA